ncbi:hypothetical protein [Yoonia sp. SS1-5]|uniref:YbjN domain-containing protein n=1 Tax=Yoonia rhodophyticola TaxID=3137370 RepID=A0AAN0NLJ0_9RHOB
MIRMLALTVLLLPASLQAQEAELHMTIPRMAEIVLALDPEAKVAGAGFEFTIDDVPVLIVTDVQANRMRAMVPIRSAEGMTEDEMQRVMQANFDTALDARYAVAQGRLWGVFIHPFAQLEKDQLISGLAQTVNIAKTYGTLYTGGAAQFGAGDSGDLQRALIEELLDRGQDI